MEMIDNTSRVIRRGNYLGEEWLGVNMWRHNLKLKSFFETELLQAVEILPR